MRIGIALIIRQTPCSEEYNVGPFSTSPLMVCALSQIQLMAHKTDCLLSEVASTAVLKQGMAKSLHDHLKIDKSFHSTT